MYQSRCQWLGDGAGTHVSVHVLPHCREDTATRKILLNSFRMVHSVIQYILVSVAVYVIVGNLELSNAQTI